MNQPSPELAHLIHAALDGGATDEQIARLNAELRADPAARDLFLQLADTHSCLAVDERLWLPAIARAELSALAPAASRRAWFTWRPLAAAAAGIVFGMLCTSVVSAYVAPRAVALASRLSSLVDGSFESRSGRLPSGFPEQFGLWSGDAAEGVELPADELAEGARALHFISPEADDGDPGGRAISCDVFQLVDLRPFRSQADPSGESQLELQARFRDARPANRQPSITFFCQIYLFSGEPSALRASWPRCISEAVSSGSAQLTTLGGDLRQWRSLTAKCLFPSRADFAVVQIAARPNLRPAKLDGVFADDVQLTLKTSPALPTRLVQR